MEGTQDEEDGSIKSRNPLFLFVPIRNSKLLVNSKVDESTLPYLKVDARHSCGVLGRVQLLQSLWMACGCSGAHTRRGTTSNKCAECLHVTNWAKRSLSKELFHFRPIQEGVHVYVRKDAKFVATHPHNCIQRGQKDGQRNEYTYCNFAQCPIEKFTNQSPLMGDDWIGPVLLRVHDILRLNSPDGVTTTAKPLEFRVVQVLQAVKPSQESSRIFHGCRSQPRLLERQNQHEDAEGSESDHRGHDLAETNESPNSFSDGPCQELKSLSSNAISNKEESTVDTTAMSNVPLLGSDDQESSSKPTCKAADPDQATLDVIDIQRQCKEPRRSLVIYLVRKGIDMTAPLLGDSTKGLTAHILQRGAQVIQSFDKQNPPTHIVVSNHPIKPESIATACGFQSVSDLEDFMDEHEIICATRRWVERGDSIRKPPLEQPTLLDRYMGLSSSGKRRISPGSNIMQRSTRLRGGNHNLADFFLQVSKLYQECPLQDSDQWRAYSFSLTAGRLRHLDFEVSDDPSVLQRLAQTKGFGSTSMEMIRQFFRSGTSSSRLRELRTDPQRVVMQRFMKIWGVGPVKARELLSAGYSTIEEVKRAADEGEILLDRNQYIGLLCYEDIQEEMTRTEVERIFNIVEAAFKTHYSAAVLEIMGSYRRGKTACGDVDILVTHPSFNIELPGNALGEIIDLLHMQGHIAHHLTYINGMMSSTTDRLGFHMRSRLTNPRQYGVHSYKYDSPVSGSSYMGVFHSPCVPGRNRRVDIKWYPYRERVFATLYFTGNGYFNRAMRLWASRKYSYTLNDHGLFLVDTNTRVMEAATERQVFDKLGLMWKEAGERDCFDAIQGNGESAVQLKELSRRALDQDSREHKWIN